MLILLLTTWSRAQAPDPAEPGSEPAPPTEPDAPAPDEPAAPAPDEPAAPAPPDEPDIEVVVWGEEAIRKARSAVTHRFEELGYRLARRKEGDTVFRGHRGKVVFHEDGTLSFGTALVGVTPPPPDYGAADPRRDPLGGGTPMESGAGPWFWLGQSKAKTRAVRTEVLDGTRAEVSAYVDVVRRTAFEESLRALPDRLDRLWRDGTPLEEAGPALATPEARRGAVLEHWATRADTPEGARISAAIEAWLDAVVQSSEHPITDEERATYEARRTDGRTLRFMDASGE